MNFRPDTMLSKLILLYVFDRIEIALTENTIMEICWSRNNWLNYMEIVDIIPGLIEMKFLVKAKDADMEERYSITELGRDCLSHFHYQIPENLKNEIAEFCKEHRMDLKRSQEYVCNFTKTKDDNYLTTLKIKDITEVNAIDIKIKFPTRQQAVDACKLWKKNAPFVYASLYESLSEKPQDDKDKPVI